MASVDHFFTLRGDRTRRDRDEANAGFTIVELLVVISVTGVLLGLILPARAGKSIEPSSVGGWHLKLLRCQRGCPAVGGIQGGARNAPEFRAAKLVDFVRTTTNNMVTRNPDEPGADWNQPNLIWNPRGPAIEGPGN